MKKPTPHDIEILAKTVYGEARGEPQVGKYAVAWVVRNRAEQAKGRIQFGDGTLAGACLQPYQFSCWNKGDPSRKIIDNLDIEAKRCKVELAIAKAVAAGSCEDPTEGCTFYHAVGTLPFWSQGVSPACRIGRHIFYRGIR